MAKATDLTEIDEVHDLYRIDPSEFVEARAALVKQLRSEGRKDEAKAVVKLRKPSAASWALDQVAVDQPELLGDALAAGEALQVATTETLEGDASNLRSATDAERKAAAKVIDAAATHLPSLTGDHRERMTATLRAAISDEDVRAQLLAGLLATDHEPPAIGFAAASAGSPSPAEAAPPKVEAAKKAPGSAKAKLAEAPAEEPTRPKRKVRRVGTPSSAKKAAVDEVDAKRRSKEVERLQAEEAERKRADEERAKERQRQQAQLDATARKARTSADRLEEKARKAEEAAAAARADADEANAAADDAEHAASAGPPG